MSDENDPAPSEGQDGTVATETKEANEAEEAKVTSPDDEQTEAADETDASDDQSDTDDEEEEEKKPKRKSSGYQRLKSRHQQVLAELEALKAEQANPKETLKEPTLDDFDGDWDRYNQARQEFQIRKILREERDAEREATQKSREAAVRQELVQDLFERTDEIRERVPDFDEAMEDLTMEVGSLNGNLQRFIAESDKGPLILYHLGKNPHIAARINGASAIEQAREIGRLEAKLTLPAPKRKTGAPDPIKTPAGGATQPRDIHALAKSENIDDYVKARKGA
jgi:hypothetical protein